MTLENWISDINKIIDEKKILAEHSVDPWEKRFQKEQIKLYDEKLDMLLELQGYRRQYEKRYKVEE